MIKLAFIDTETTGLDPCTHEIIEIAVKIIDDHANGNNLDKVLQSFEYKLKPRELELASPRALEVNGYNEEEWKDGLHWSRSLCVDLLDHLDGCIIIGHNVQFDINFLREECKRQGIKCPRFATLDTKGMARYLWSEKELPSVSMDRIRAYSEYFETEGAHRAMKDVDDCVTLWDMFKKSMAER